MAGGLTLDPIIVQGGLDPMNDIDYMAGSFIDYLDRNRDEPIQQVVENWLETYVQNYMEQVVDTDNLSYIIYSELKTILEDSWDNFYHTLTQYSLFDELMSDGVSKVSSLLGLTPPDAYDSYDNTMSGSEVMPLRALAHYLFGNGEQMRVNLADLDLNVTPDEINVGGGVTLDSMLTSGDYVGTRNITVEHFGYDTYNDDASTGLTLGNVTLKLEGEVSRFDDGSWTFDGEIRAYNDFYDFNPSGHRAFWAEIITEITNQLPGTSYGISIDGALSVNWNSWTDWQ